MLPGIPVLGINQLNQLISNRFASFIDPDARFVGSKVDRSREAIAEAWAVFFTGELPSIRWRPQFIEVLESGDLARLETLVADRIAVHAYGDGKMIILDEDGKLYMLQTRTGKRTGHAALKIAFDLRKEDS